VGSGRFVRARMWVKARPGGSPEVNRRSGWLFWLGVGLLLAVLVGGCQTKGLWGPPPPVPPPPPPAPTPPPKVEYQIYYVAADRLNLRACPGMDCPKIAALTRNQEVEKVGESQGWFQVRARQDGTLGWVDARYLASAPVPETATLPATEASPPRAVKPQEVKPEPKVEVKPKAKPKAREEGEAEEETTPRRRRVPEAEAAEPPAPPKAAPEPETPVAPPPAPAAPSEPPKKKIKIM